MKDDESKPVFLWLAVGDEEKDHMRLGILEPDAIAALAAFVEKHRELPGDINATLNIEHDGDEGSGAQSLEPAPVESRRPARVRMRPHAGSGLKLRC